MSVSFQSNSIESPYGNVSKVGTTADNRVIYQVTDYTGKSVGKMSVAIKDCDTFEKSYNDIMEAAPKYQKFMQEHQTPDSLKSRKYGVIGTVIAGTVIGLAAPLKFFNKTWAKATGGVVGVAVGLVGGLIAGTKMFAPPGLSKINKATHNISRLDIQALEN